MRVPQGLPHSSLPTSKDVNACSSSAPSDNEDVCHCEIQSTALSMDDCHSATFGTQLRFRKRDRLREENLPQSERGTPRRQCIPTDSAPRISDPVPREGTMHPATMQKPSRNMGLNLLFASFIIIQLISSCHSKPIENVFQNPLGRELPFEHMVVDRKSTGRVYVGAVNRLYELDPMLKMRKQVETGPHDDNPECQSLERECAAEKSLRNNYNKGLTIYLKKSKLVECSSLYQGRCRMRNLYDITKKGEDSPPLVANDKDSSTVVFVSPGPPNPEVNDVLYVASTFTGLGKYRSEVPAIGSRSLEKETLYHIAWRDVSSQTQHSVLQNLRSSFKIEYVTGFHTDKFAYIVSRQQSLSTGPSPYISKLIRLCHNDKLWWSYIEVPLKCNSSDGNYYNLIQDAYLGKPGYDLATAMGIKDPDADVLFAVFAHGEGENRKEPTAKSALCVYSLEEIDKVYLENVQLCNRGESIRGMEWFKTTGDCKSTRFTEGFDSSCGNEVNFPTQGYIPIVREPVWTTSNLLLTAVTASKVHGFTVAFLGTSEGSVVKVVVERENQGFDYQTVEVSRNRRPILQDMELDMSGEYLLVMTKDSISKMKVHECQEDVKCMGCLKRKDPYCGWCSLDNKCSVKPECQGGSSDHWLNYKTSECTSIRSVNPSSIQITSAKYLELQIDNLPSIENQLSCVFTVLGRSLNTGASRTGDTIHCTTPQTSIMPRIPPGQHSIVATLSVQVDPRGPDFATTNFTFYDCSTFTSCSECVESPFPCDWCADSHQCTKTIEDFCRGEHIINGQARPGQSRRRGEKYCPAIKSSVTDIYVPSGTTKKIVVETANLLNFQKNFECEFKIGHSVHKKRAIRKQNRIECEAMDFVYFADSPTGTEVAQFSVIWAKGKALDNSQGIQIVMYKCDHLASNCGLCLSMDRNKFSCGWCAEKGYCATESECAADSPAASTSVTGWLTNEMCPHPKIIDFNPKSGPIEGGTLVTITGINLGRKFSDIQRSVQINNVPCEPIQSEYATATKIVCRTQKLNHRKGGSNPVVIKLGEAMNFVAISSDHFSYVDPVIARFHPQKGPQAGGTVVRIEGEHLNAGSHVSVLIAGIECKVVNRSKDNLQCKTGAASNIKPGGLQITFDNARKNFVAVQYAYRANPIVTSINPEKSTESGGVLIEARGDRFNLTQEARMFVSLRGKETSLGELCKIVSNERLQCLSPPIPTQSTRRKRQSNDISASEPLAVDYGFHLDGLQIKVPSTGKTGFGPFLIYPDPVVESFAGENRIKFYKGADDYLTITGNSMDLAATKNDVRIQIGKGWCNLTSFQAQAIICQPPKEDPGPTSTELPHPEVVVSIGSRQYRVGYLSYEVQENQFFGGIPMDAIIAIAVAVTVFILAIAILLIAYRRKSTRHDRQMKNLKSQMDTIEMKVASECKEAFAELQTSMNEMAADMAVGIPFLSYREYALQVLFPNTVNHPVMRELEVEPHRAVAMEKGLRQFNQLLMNKTFLLLFVRTMEGSKYFLGKDRVYVGSLLMVILQEKMEYCTDILKTLLAELIEKTVERRYQPKILFRRSESVAERMLAAWFTFLMHRYLQECAGQPLFMLYWAIKQQIEKGPVDAVTLEARYSLSEEKLLRQAVDFQPITVFVVGINGSQQQVETPVRVLDIDTITQVKEKCLDAIYRTTPYSMRPSANDLDLEWRQGVSGRLVLQDIDVSTKTEVGGWKRYNTMMHYRVPNNASLALVHRQASMYNLSLLSERSDKSSTFSLKNSPTLNRAFSPFAANNTGTTGSRGEREKDHETGYKLYHLIKPNDQGIQDTSDQNRPGAKLVSEIYLTRLLTTKGTLQKFTEDLLESIFSTTHRGSTLPLAVKYMFDFMDDQALSHGITDLEVVHTWKSNALPLRFWVNLIKNPQFVFDIPRLAKVEGCLSVVAQTLMDACSTQDHQLTKDSPSSKLLFARDILIYRDWVDKYYQDIRMMPAISDQDMNAFLAEESRSHQQQFYVYSALSELYKYLEQYKDQIAIALDEDEFARRSRLPGKFAQMLRVMEGDLYGTLDGRA